MLFGLRRYPLLDNKDGGSGGGNAGGEGNGGNAGGGKGGDGAGGGNAGGGGEAMAALLAEMKAMRAEITEMKSKKGGDGDPTLDEIERGKKAKLKDQQTQEKIVTAAKFNIRFDTFLKEYSGILPADANEISKVATAEKYPDELKRSSVIKAALMASFFKEEENLKLLSESQLARWKAYQALGTVGREEEAADLYEVVFEPTVNHARSVRQAELRAKEDLTKSLKGSTDSDIIMRKVHERQIRALSTNYKLNDVLFDQAKNLGLAKSA